MTANPSLHYRVVFLLALATLLNLPRAFGLDFIPPPLLPIHPVITLPNLNDNLVAYWPLTETSGTRSALSGTGYHLLPQGEVDSTSGPFNQPCAALRQKGSLSSDLPLSITGSTQTVSLWVRVREADTMLLTQSIGSYGTEIKCIGGILQVRSIFGVAMDVAPMSPNEWHHLTSTWDGTQFQISLDGVSYNVPVPLQGPILVPLQPYISGDNPPLSAYPGSIVLNAPAPFSLGGNLPYFNPILPTPKPDFDVAEVGFWSRALSRYEIGLLYDNGLGELYPFSAPQTQPDLTNIQGDYRGVFTYLPQTNPGTSGFIGITLNSRKQFTGKFTFGTSVSSFKGQLDDSFSAQVTFQTKATGPITLNLQLSNPHGARKLTGIASGWFLASTPVSLTRIAPASASSDAVGSYPVSFPYNTGNDIIVFQPIPPGGGGFYPLANQSATPNTNTVETSPAPTADSILIPYPLQNPPTPHTWGTGLVTLQPNGRAALKATLNDGTKLTASGRLTEDHTWFFYNALYANHGSLAGSLSIDPSTASCAGALYWNKPVTRSKNLPQAVATTLSLSGTKQ